jgi:hypothetical protein
MEMMAYLGYIDGAFANTVIVSVGFRSVVLMRTKVQ